MKNVYTIDEVAKYFDLPKSTLLYWEKEGLIHFDRVAENNYRKAAADTVFQIENVLHLRNLGVPIDEIKAVPLMSLEERFEMYTKAVEEADRKLQTLEEIKRSARKQIQQIKETGFLRTHPYRSEPPDFRYLIAHSRDTICAECFETGRFVILMREPEQGIFIETFISEEAGASELLWERPDENTMWRTFLLDIKTDDDGRRTNNLPEHLSALQKMGCRTGTLVARYLSEAMEDDALHIYFKAYIEAAQNTDKGEH